VGCLVGFFVGQRLFPGASYLVHILVGIGLGLLGALLLPSCFQGATRSAHRI
jgi:hypothetical protein